MAVTVYRSTDSSAPTLSGTAGDLVNLLDKCLVAGYGSQTAAGWSKPFTGTNTASFRMGGGNQFYLDVNDTGPGTGGAREARLRGYETMTAVATGSGLFPTSAQLANGIIIRKSSTADGTTRVWTLIADDRTMYLLTQTADTAGQWMCFSFGDFYSYLASSDGYRALIMGRTIESTTSATSSEIADRGDNSVQAGHYFARNYTGVGGAIQFAKYGDMGKSGGSTYPYAFTGAFGVPNPTDGMVWLSPITVAQPAGNFRGNMRGAMHWLHTLASFADQDTVAGAGPYAGHTFLLFKTTPNASAHCIDITGPWDTN